MTAHKEAPRPSPDPGHRQVLRATAVLLAIAFCTCVYTTVTGARTVAAASEDRRIVALMQAADQAGSAVEAEFAGAADPTVTDAVFASLNAAAEAAGLDGLQFSGGESEPLRTLLADPSAALEQARIQSQLPDLAAELASTPEQLAASVANGALSGHARAYAESSSRSVGAASGPARLDTLTRAAESLYDSSRARLVAGLAGALATAVGLVFLANRLSPPGLALAQRLSGFAGPRSGRHGAGPGRAVYRRMEPASPVSYQPPAVGAPSAWAPAAPDAVQAAAPAPAPTAVPQASPQIPDAPAQASVTPTPAASGTPEAWAPGPADPAAPQFSHQVPDASVQASVPPVPAVSGTPEARAPEAADPAPSGPAPAPAPDASPTATAPPAFPLPRPSATPVPSQTPEAVLVFTQAPSPARPSPARPSPVRPAPSPPAATSAAAAPSPAAAPEATPAPSSPATPAVPVPQPGLGAPVPSPAAGEGLPGGDRTASDAEGYPATQEIAALGVTAPGGPLLVTDVLKEALAQVARPRQVRWAIQTMASVPEPVAARLAHAVAELIDAAAAKSPTLAVQVAARSTASQLVITISDRAAEAPPGRLALGPKPTAVLSLIRRLGGSLTASPALTGDGTDTILTLAIPAEARKIG